SYAAIKVLLPKEATTPVYTLVNRSADPIEAGGVQARIAEACRRFLGLRTVAAGHVPTAGAHPAPAPPLVLPGRAGNAPAVGAAKALGRSIARRTRCGRSCN